MPVAVIHSSMRARSSSSRRNRRRTGSRPAKSRSCEAVSRASASSSSSETTDEHGVGLAQRAVGEPDPQVGQPTVAVGCPRASGGAERGVDERGEGLDVRAHHDDVARLERRVVGEEVEDRVAQHLDLAGPAVARVHLHAVVGGVERHPLVGSAGQGRAGRCDVGADVGLEPAQQGVGVTSSMPWWTLGAARCRGRAASRGRRGPTWRAAGCAARLRSGRRRADESTPVAESVADAIPQRR